MGGFIIFLTPGDVDRMLCETLCELLIEKTDEYALDLDLNSFRFHRGFVFFLEGRAAERQVIKGDDGIGATRSLNRIINRLFQ